MDLATVITIATLLSPPLPGNVTRWDETGIASTYMTPGDKFARGTPACARRGEKLSPQTNFCAHRQLPCGTVVHVYLPRTKRSAYCVVADRGPYGARLPDGSWALKRRKSDPGTWRGIIDLSPGTTAAIGSRGWEWVKIRRASRDELSPRESSPVTRTTAGR